jgi:hypothetical protein
MITVAVIAESWAAGWRWIVVPDDALIAGRARRNPDALARWRRIADSLAFFERQIEWRRYAPAGPLSMEIDPSSSRYEGYRVPLILVDLIAARPIDLAIIDGVESCDWG